MDMYQSLCTEFYDLDKPEASAEALNFYRKYIENAKGPILEPMCGSGRYLIPFLEKGFDIEGLDSSLHMLKACMKKCVSKKIEPVLYSQFVTDLTLDKKYNLIFIPNGSFGLVSEDNQLKECLKNFYDHLSHNGKLVLEIETTRAVPKQLEVWHGRMIDKSDGSKILLNSLPTYDDKTKILRVIQRYELIHHLSIMQTEIEDFHLRLFQNDELEDWLADAGFKNISRFKAYGLAEPDANDEAIIYEATKL